MHSAPHSRGLPLFPSLAGSANLIVILWLIEIKLCFRLTPGLIIDAFGELRDQQEQVKEDMEVSPVSGSPGDESAPGPTASQCVGTAARHPQAGCPRPHAPWGRVLG